MYRAGAAVVSTIIIVDITHAFKGESKDADFQLSASYPVHTNVACCHPYIEN